MTILIRLGTFFEVIVQLVFLVERSSALTAKEVFDSRVNPANVSVEMPLFKECRTANAAFMLSSIRVINHMILQLGVG